MCAWFTRGQKMALDPLELEFQAIMSCHVGAGNQTPVHCKRNNH